MEWLEVLWGIYNQTEEEKKWLTLTNNETMLRCFGMFVCVLDLSHKAFRWHIEHIHITSTKNKFF